MTPGTRSTRRDSSFRLAGVNQLVRITILLGLALTTTGGCGIRSELTVFHKLPPYGGAKTFVILPKESQHGLEFESYAALIG